MRELLSAQLAQLELRFKVVKVTFNGSISGESLLHVVFIRSDPILDVHIQAG